MEITYNLDKGVALIEGREECICKGEPYYGASVVSLGTHHGCSSLLSLILVANAVAIEKEPINVIRVYPELEKRTIDKTPWVLDNTDVEFCFEEKVILKTTWLQVRNRVTPAVEAVRDMDPGLIMNATKGIGGKACRGLSLKYLPAKQVKAPVTALSDDDKNLIMEAMKKVTYQEAMEKYHEKFPNEHLIDSRTGKLFVKPPPKPKVKEVFPHQVMPEEEEGQGITVNVTIQPPVQPSVQPSLPVPDAPLDTVAVPDMATPSTVETTPIAITVPDTQA